MAISFIIRELCALDYSVEAVDSKTASAVKRADRYTNDWEDYFENGQGFDLWLARVVRDACILPFGGAAEVGYRGDELDWVLHVDAGTLMPTYQPKLPYAQVNPDNWADMVFFKPGQLQRLRVNPRSDIRYKEYQVAPTEDAYLAIEALALIYVYYMQQLGDTPPPGILDLLDMTKEEAEEWAEKFAELIKGVDALKVPVLYGHTKPAVFVPFTRTPQDLNVVEQFKRFCEILLGKYGLSIGDLRLFEHDATKAGERVSQLITERSGIGFWATMIEAYLNRILRKLGLRFKFNQPRPEKDLVVAKVAQTKAAWIQAAAGGKPLLTQESALEQLKDWDLFTVDVEVPEPEPLPPALAANAGLDGATQEEVEEEDEDTRDAFDDQDLAKKIALTVKAELGEWGSVEIDNSAERFVAWLAEKFFVVDFHAGNRTRLAAIVDATARTFVEQREKAELRTKQNGDSQVDAEALFRQIEDLLDRNEWWKLQASDAEVAGVLEEFYLYGLDEEAARIENLRTGGTARVLGLAWNVRDPAVVEIARSQAAKMVTNVDAGTKAFLRNHIVMAVEEGLAGPDAAGRILQSMFGDSQFSRARLYSIANFEINSAMSQAGQLLRDRVGLSLKQWFTNRANPCEICLANEAKGEVKADFEYDSVFGPTQGPPGHPQTCRCITTAVEREVLQLGEFEWPFQLAEAVAS